MVEIVVMGLGSVSAAVIGLAGSSQPAARATGLNRLVPSCHGTKLTGRSSAVLAFRARREQAS
jgi:hypothetical protein